MFVYSVQPANFLAASDRLERVREAMAEIGEGDPAHSPLWWHVKNACVWNPIHVGDVYASKSEAYMKAHRLNRYSWEYRRAGRKTPTLVYFVVEHWIKDEH